MLRGKNILVGVTGGIAAVKIPNFVRLLVKEGAHVQVIMTQDAEHFVTAKSLSVLSRNPVLNSFFDADNNWNNHVKTALWADSFILAPATANTIAKMGNGICDNLLMAVYLSLRCPVFIAPAMDLDMLRHPATKKNLETVRDYGHIIIDPESGELASGLSGKGRMAEPETLIEVLRKHFEVKGALNGKKVLLTAGPTYEMIDPVRFIGNKSSGKMGIALADVFAKEGAEVVLILGPTHLRPQENSVKIVHAESAEEMLEQCLLYFKKTDIAILSAAVADFKPREKAHQKIKKGKDEMLVDLVRNPDILENLGKLKSKTQVLGGFALETENLMDNAKEKLKRKNLDFIVANSATENGNVFGSDMNKISIIDHHNKIYNFELKHKLEVAKDIVEFVVQLIK